jgi:hypothetical protein
MLLCDNCNGGYHPFCFKPELTQVHADIWYCSSCSLIAPWFSTQTMPHFSWLRSGGGIHENFISALYIYIYIYSCVCVCISFSFWLINFYLWLVLVFLFSKISYGFTPLWHYMSRHYTSRQLSCLYAWPYTWWSVISMPIMSFNVNVRL